MMGTTVIVPPPATTSERGDPASVAGGAIEGQTDLRENSNWQDPLNAPTVAPVIADNRHRSKLPENKSNIMLING